jgi:hypothetical protein
MPHLSPAHHETSKHDSTNKTKVKEKQNEIILDSNSNLAKSMTHHNQTKELTTWFLIFTYGIVMTQDAGNRFAHLGTAADGDGG